MRWMVLLGLVLSGCTGKDTDTDPPVETGDTDPDIPDTFLGRTDKPKDVERDGVALRAGLVHVELGQDGIWTIGAHLAGGKLSGTVNFGIELPTSAPDPAVALPPGWTGTLYLPVVYDDIDKDDVFIDNEDDLILGFSADRWLVHVQSGDGVAPGWRVVDPTGEAWTDYPLTEQSAVPLYGLTATAKLQGVYEGTGTNLGVVAIDERFPGDGVGDWWALDTVMERLDSGGYKFEGDADSRPPIEAFQFPGDVDVRYVRATLRMYEDTDSSGDYDPNVDTLRSQRLCYGGVPLVLRYSDTPRSIAIARQIAALGWTTGWRVVTGPYGASTEVPRADVQWARFDDACAL